MTAPQVAPGLLAALIARLPARLARRLDADPTMAAPWPTAIEGAALVVQAGEATTVRLSPAAGVVASVDDVSCTCLLSPACLHVVAVLRGLPLGGTAADVAAEETEGATDVAAGRALTAAALEACQRAVRASGSLLAIGATNAGLVVEAELLRAAQACRTEGLHRPAGALLRTVAAVRELHAERAEFRLGSLAAAVTDAVASADRLLRRPDEADPELVGRARRSYVDVGSLRLTGICSEPVVGGGGHAGVVTHLLSGDGRAWSVTGVLPGDVTRVLAAFGGPAAIGDSAVPHRRLCIEGLHVAAATASPDGRLGAGRGVKAVTREARGWEEQELAARFAEPLVDQVPRAWPDGLVFATGTVAGTDGTSLVLDLSRPDAGSQLRVVPILEHLELPALENLRLLAAVPQLGLRVVGRLAPAQPRTVRLLAVAPVDAAALALPAAWGGRVQVGLDRLQRGHLPSANDTPVVLPERPGTRPLDPLDPFRRRLQRAALGGRATFGPLARSGLDQDASRLRKANLPTAARLLHALGATADDTASFTHTWAAAALYESSCTAVLAQDRWLGPT